MSANLTVYCLSKVTDYLEFERLCNDLMYREGYKEIEPLGGHHDKGRDALYTDKSGETTIFAYSVREDWQAKLGEDAHKIWTHQHKCDKLIFLTNAEFSAAERDNAVDRIKERYGFALDLYGVERLRVIIEGQEPDLRKNHPAIFDPQFFQPRSNPDAQQDHLLILASAADTAFAHWLARKLTSEGYCVWCDGLDFDGDSCPNDLEWAIRNRVSIVLSPYSEDSLKDPEVVRLRTISITLGRGRESEILIPIAVSPFNHNLLDRTTQNLAFIPFEANWAIGLSKLLRRLSMSKISRPNLAGRLSAAHSIPTNSALLSEGEVLTSNCFKLTQLPKQIHCFSSSRRIPRSLLAEWAFREVAEGTLLAFHEPKSRIIKDFAIRNSGSVQWEDSASILGIKTQSLIVELVNKSLSVKCIEKGLRYCNETRLHYFPRGLISRERLPYVRTNGKRTHVLVTGKRTFGMHREPYFYALAPSFNILMNGPYDTVAVLSIRVRITDQSGATYTEFSSNSRRKHLCKNWWNPQWLARVLAVSQFLGDGTRICIGSSNEEEIIFDQSPIQLLSPISINEHSLSASQAHESLNNETEHESDQDA